MGMKIITGIKELKKQLLLARAEKLTVGLVPTMGYLHEGHLSLVRRARRENDIVVVSIFVNPIQFGPKEDLGKYPRDLKRDAAMLKKTGVDYIFNPSPREMFSTGFGTYVEVPELSNILCGKSRPGHFKGVATVVAKLLNIVQPDRSYYGLKDFQQFTIIKKMAKDLNIPGQIIGCPTIREKDGLAMSSRNTYLKAPKERKAAVILSKAIQEAKRLVRAGEKDAVKIKRKLIDLIKKEPLARLDYVALVDPGTLRELKRIKGPAQVILAVRIGKTRLIDNALI